MKPHEIIEYVLTEVAKEYRLSSWRVLFKKSNDFVTSTAIVTARHIIALFLTDDHVMDMFHINYPTLKQNVQDYRLLNKKTTHRIQVELYNKIKEAA